jgi:folate-binding protein YgfZ
MTTAAIPIADGVDAGLPWHYGDPFGEQRLLSTRAGLVSRVNRDVLVVPGADRLGWLHSICSQHVSDLRDGDSTEALVLSPHGHVEQHWQVTELGEQVWIDTEPGAAPTVLGYLTKMQFLKRVEPADVSDRFAVYSLLGPDAEQVLADAGLPVPAAGAVALDGGGFVRRMGWPVAPAFDLLLPAGSAVIDRLAVQPAGLWAFEALRVAARRPRLGFETDHRTIPHEVGWIGPAVHLNKGCYRGQETVARVQNLGKPPRRLVLAHLSGESDALPTPGTAVDWNGRAVGFLGTAVQHYEYGPIALAVIKRSLAGDAELSVSGVPLAIDEGV